jgi:hypothetical protein
VANILLERGPKNDDELHAIVKAFWGVNLPRHTCGDPNHTAPFQCFADAYFERDGTISLWHGSRGLSGKSFMLSILGITKAFFRGSDVNLLGGSLAQSTNIHEHMRAALEYQNAPREMIVTEAQYLIKLNNKARIRPLTASQKTVRGPHPPFLLLDEIDEMDIDILNAALGQPMPQKNHTGEILKPYTVMCSTWQNAGGTFETKLREFEKRGLPIKTWCYKCTSNPIDGWLSEETIAGKRQEIPDEMWRVEYDLGEPSIGNRAFNTTHVDKMWSLPFEPLVQKESKDFWEYTFEQPQPSGVYIASADWGKDKDYTVVYVMRMDVFPHRLAYYLRVNRRPYPVMIKHFNDAINKYSAEAVHDATGVGNAVNDYVDTRAAKFVMTGEKRSGMLTEFVASVERDMFQFPKIPIAYAEMKYCRTGDLYQQGGPDNYHLPDTVCAGALAWRSGKKWGGGAGDPIVVPKTSEPHRYEKHFAYEQVTDEIVAMVGDVVVVTQRQEGEYNFLV